MNGVETTTSRTGDLYLPAKDSMRGEVLLFHGITATPKELAFLSTSLNEAGYVVRAPLLSGHGTNIRDLQSTSIASWDSDIAKALEGRKDRKGPLFLGGLSFGSLLALRACLRFELEVSGLVLLSPPVLLRKEYEEMAINLLSYLPESFLNLLGSWPKGSRTDDNFLEEREAYESHSLASVARLAKIRREFFNAAWKISCPVLVLQDPHDHRISSRGPEILKHLLASTDISSMWIEGASHEMTIGQRREEVVEKVVQFLERCSDAA